METDRLTIRRFSPGDWQDLYEYLSQEAVVRYEPYTVYTENECRQEALKRSSRSDFWAVCLKASGKLIGNLYFAKKQWDTWELGYVFNADYHGHGYATESATALLDDAFRHQNARRVVALCNPENTASWMLLKRLGLRREGHLIENIAFKKDKEGRPIWCDTYEYAILSREWAERHP